MRGLKARESGHGARSGDSELKLSRARRSIGGAIDAMGLQFACVIGGNHEDEQQARAVAGIITTGFSPPGRLLDAVYANLVDEMDDLGCLERLVADAERSSQAVDDGMNSTEASEERHAVAEAAAMR